MNQILRLPAALALNGLSRSTTYDHISKGIWPSPISLSARATGFPASECEAVVAARIAGKSDAEIRALGRELHAARNTGQPQAQGLRVNENPNLVAGREKYWADVRAGIRPHPRSKKGVQL